MSNSCQFPYRKNPNRILTDHYILQHFIGFISHTALKRSHYFKKTSSVYLQCQGDTEYISSPNYQLHKARRLHTHTNVPNTLWCTSQLERTLGTRGQLTNDNTRRRPSIPTEITRDRQTRFNCFRIERMK